MWTMSSKPSKFLLILVASSKIAWVTCDKNPSDVDLSPLGINSFADYEYSNEVVVDDNCDYKLTLTFSHNWTNPLGGPDTCIPGVKAPDGIDYIAGRWHWERLPKHQRDATGIDHPSIDYNPCGHPGPGFLAPHYDIHFYTVTPEFRILNMTCALVPGTPACDPGAQDTTNGLDFFVIPYVDDLLEDEDNTTGAAIRPITNMPLGFEAGIEHAVIHMGMHSWNFQEQPLTPEEWINPVFILCTFAGEITAIEPMLPVSAFAASESLFYEEDLTYVDQTMSTLPYYYSVDYNADSGVSTVVMKGKSRICKAEYEAAEAAYLQEMTTAAGGETTTASGAVHWSGISIVSVVIGMLLDISSFL